MSTDIFESNYRKVIAEAIADSMRSDPAVMFFGEDVAVAGGAFKTTAGLLEEFGPRRVRDTPISEQAIVGAAIGSALVGVRPVAEIMFADFAAVCFDQLVNQLAKYRYMTAGQARLPVTVRMSNGAGAGFAAQHSQPAENWFLNVPGLKLAVPGTVSDLYGCIRSAIADDDPVLIFEHKNLFSKRGSVQRGHFVPVGEGIVTREGHDITVVATQQMSYLAEDAARLLEGEGISCEIIDPRWLVPFDDALVLESIERTSRLLVVQEGSADGSWGASLISRVASGYFVLLDAPPTLVCSPSTPVPFAEELERAWIPSVDQICAEIRKLVAF